MSPPQTTKPAMSKNFPAHSGTPPIDDEADPDETMKSMDDSEDDEPDVGKVSEIKEALHSNLEAVKAGPIAGFNRLQNLPDLKIQIGDSTIGLPLRERDAQTIIQAARNHSGQGRQASANPGQTSVWELSPTQFDIRSPEWSTYLNDLVANVAQEMNPEGAQRDCSFHAELSKMILYEPGATFDDRPASVFHPFSDLDDFVAEKLSRTTPGMFGTLLVCLPSPHAGGSVWLCRQNVQHVFMSCTVAQSYTWW